MIIVTVDKPHYTALPLYTHEGRGLRGRSDKENWIGIQDPRANRIPEQSPNGILQIAFLKADVKRYEPLTTVHITGPQSYHFNTPCVMEGYLDTESASELIRLHFEKIRIQAERYCSPIESSPVSFEYSTVSFEQQRAFKANSEVQSLFHDVTSQPVSSDNESPTEHNQESRSWNSHGWNSKSDWVSHCAAEGILGELRHKAQAEWASEVTVFLP